MKTIYLIDYLGIHCGMHYYLGAFKEVISSLPNTEIHILSNYSEHKSNKPFFKNQYTGCLINKAALLLWNILTLSRFIKKHPKDVFIYLTYGTYIDLFFLNIIAKAKHHIIDIHEAIAQNVDKNNCLKYILKNIYCNKINSVISHSSRTDDFLNEYQYKQNRFHVPHFKYIFPKEYSLNNVSSQLIGSIKRDKINLLFFGNLNESKGVDILIEATNRLSEDIAHKINVIIAGKDFDGSINSVIPNGQVSINIFKRHITDDELCFLYQKVDYLCLPYRKTSQSGILEMAFYFKRPIIASNIPYFKSTLKIFPSFGILANEGNDHYADAITKAVLMYSNYNFYDEEDYAKYEHRQEVQSFVKNLKSWLDND